MTRLCGLAVPALLLITGWAAGADDALAQATARAEKAGGEIRKDSQTGFVELLSLDTSKATDDDVIAVVDALKKAKPESKVRITKVFLGPNHTDAAVKKVAELKDIGFLCVRRSKVTDKAFAELKPLKQLTTLRANETGITDEGLKSLGEVGGLQQIFLDETKITDEGLKHLTKLRLVLVSVKKTKVTEEGAKSLKGVSVER